MAECAARRRSSASCLRTRSIAFRMKSDRVQGLPARAREILRLRSSSIRKQTTRLVFVLDAILGPLGSTAFLTSSAIQTTVQSWRGLLNFYRTSVVFLNRLHAA